MTDQDLTDLAQRWAAAEAAADTGTLDELVDADLHGPSPGRPPGPRERPVPIERTHP